MNIEHKFIDETPYLLVTISDTVITPQHAISNFKFINDECQKANCRKVLLNALTVEKRDISNHEIREIGEQIGNIQLALYCKPELLDQAARLLSAVTYSDGYIVKHFGAEDEAKNWLLGASR